MKEDLILGKVPRYPGLFEQVKKKYPTLQEKSHYPRWKIICSIIGHDFHGVDEICSRCGKIQVDIGPPGFMLAWCYIPVGYVKVHGD